MFPSGNAKSSLNCLYLRATSNLPGCSTWTRAPRRERCRHTITVDFYTATGALLESVTPLAIYVDNNPCTATLTAPTLNGVSANACGFLPYNPLTTASENVVIPFGASQPEGFATYAFRLTRGTANVPLSQPSSGPVGGITPATDPITETVAAPTWPVAPALAEMN